MEYAKILVGEHAGKTLFIKSFLNDHLERIEIRIDGTTHIFKGWEYELVDMYGRYSKKPEVVIYLRKGRDN